MRTLLVFGEKTFQIEIPDDSKITFGPWSPPTGGGRNGAEMFGRPGFSPVGTLRIYQGNKDNIVALFAGVTGFRDLTLGYREEVAREEGATIWKDDEHGYMRESKFQRTRDWVEPDKQIEPPKSPPKSPSTATTKRSTKK